MSRIRILDNNIIIIMYYSEYQFIRILDSTVEREPSYNRPVDLSEDHEDP